MRIDSHQHFWKYNPEEYNWIDDSMSILKRDYLPADLKNELDRVNLQACIAVQARTRLEETEWLLDLAQQDPMILGVVGWVDLKSDDLEKTLSAFQHKEKLVGFREILQDKDPNFMLDKTFLKGVQYLGELGYSYDILVFPHHLKAVLEMIQKLPKQRLVIDHLAKPLIAEGKIKEWQRDIKAIAKEPHVYMKLSGMVTEAAANYKKDDFIPYMDVIFEAFGEDRVMFGSDWPVCRLRSEYQDVYELVIKYLGNHSSAALEKVFSTNALKFYQLKNILL